MSTSDRSIKTGLRSLSPLFSIREAVPADVPGIVALMEAIRICRRAG